MKKNITIFFMGTILLILIMSLVGCGGNSSGSSNSVSSDATDATDDAEKKPSLSFRLSSTSSSGGAIYEGAMKFKELVEERSNGDIEVQVYPDGQLGSDANAMDAHRTGSIEMSLPSTAMAQLSPEFGVFDIPFLFANHAAVEKFANSGIWEEDFQPLFEQHGMVGLGFWENGFRHITNDVRPIYVPEDLDGIVLRVPESRLRVAAFQEFGANPVTMDFSEVFTALQQGVVDGQENPFVQIEAGRFYEIQKYISLTNHTYTPAYLVASKLWWDELSSEHQDLMMQAAIDTGVWSREYGESVGDELLTKFEEAGMEVNEADVASFQARIEPVVNILKESIDPVFVDKIIAAAQQ